MRWKPLIEFLPLIWICLCGSACEQPKVKPPAPPTPIVRVTEVIKKTMPVEVRSIGTVRVISTVTIRPRVNGELTEVHFKEGEFVKKGQKLFTIDPRPYQTSLSEAEANLAKEKAVLRGAELDLARAERSGQTGAIAIVELDAARTAVASGRAAVASAEAQVHSAKLMLEFTTITSPIEGRTGNLLVTPGDLIISTEINPLVVINQISPIHVAFAIPEQFLPAISTAQLRGPLKVEARWFDRETPVVGSLTFVDNSIDATSGTLELKAEFPNQDRSLWPGQFVNVNLTISERPDSLVIPTSAVQSGQKGSFVYVINDKQVVEYRQIRVLFERDGEAVIEKNLNPAERVVIEGHLRLAPGMKVEVKGSEVSRGTESKSGKDSSVSGEINP